MPGKHPSVKKGDTYDALREKGYSKEKAARIANAQANGTLDYHHDHGGKGGMGGDRKK